MIRPTIVALLTAFALNAVAKEPMRPRQETHGFIRVSIPQWELATEFSVLKHDDKPGAYVPPLEQLEGSRSFGGWALAGDYDVVGLKAKDGGRYSPVTVKAGQMTDLGVLIRVPIGGLETMLLPIRDADSLLESRATLEKLRPDLVSDDVIRWEPTELPAPNKTSFTFSQGLIPDLIVWRITKNNQAPLRESLKSARSIDELIARARSALPPRTEEPGVDSHGNLYYGADLGQIRVRHPDGTWDSIDTGKLTEITAIEADGNRLVTGDLRGAIRLTTDGGTNWRLAADLGNDEAVLDVDRVGKRWLVMTADFINKRSEGLADGWPGMPRGWRLGTKLRVYSTLDDDLAGLQVIREMDLPHDGLGTIRPGSGFAHEIGVMDSYTGQAANGMYFVNGVTRLHRLDPATLSWTELDPGFRVDNFRLSGDGKVLTARRMQGIASKISVSQDAGATWQPVKRPALWVYDVVFESATVAHAIRWKGDMFNGRLEYYDYVPDRKGWQVVRESPVECVKVLRDEHGTPNYCLTASGGILALADGAWKTEFTTD